MKTMIATDHVVQELTAILNEKLSVGDLETKIKTRYAHFRDKEVPLMALEDDEKAYLKGYADVVLGKDVLTYFKGDEMIMRADLLRKMFNVISIKRANSGTDVARQNLMREAYDMLPTFGYDPAQQSGVVEYHNVRQFKPESSKFKNWLNPNVSVFALDALVARVYTNGEFRPNITSQTRWAEYVDTVVNEWAKNDDQNNIFVCMLGTKIKIKTTYLTRRDPFSATEDLHDHDCEILERMVTDGLRKFNENPALKSYTALFAVFTTFGKSVLRSATSHYATLCFYGAEWRDVTPLSGDAVVNKTVEVKAMHSPGKEIKGMGTGPTIQVARENASKAAIKLFELQHGIKLHDAKELATEMANEAHGCLGILKIRRTRVGMLTVNLDFVDQSDWNIFRDEHYRDRRPDALKAALEKIKEAHPTIGDENIRYKPPLQTTILEWSTSPKRKEGTCWDRRALTAMMIMKTRPKSMKMLKNMWNPQRENSSEEAQEAAVDWNRCKARCECLMIMATALIPPAFEASRNPVPYVHVPEFVG